MEQKKSIEHSKLFWFVIAVLLLLCVSMIGQQISMLGANVLAFKWNPFALLSILCVALVLLIIYLVRRAKVGGRVGMWYLTYLTAVLFLAVCNLLANLASSPEMYQFWNKFSDIGLVFMPPLFFIFVLAYVGNERLLYRWPTLALLLVSGTIVNIQNALASYIWPRPPVETFSWGYVSGAEHFFPYMVIYLEVTFLAASYIVFHYYRQSRNKSIRKQSRIILLSAVLPLLFGTFSEAILPGVFGLQLPPMVVWWLTLGCAMVTYAILRYGLFHYDSSALASVVVNTVRDGLAVLDDKDQVIQLNEAACRLLRVKEHEAIGEAWGSLTSVYQGNNLVAEDERLDCRSVFNDRISSVSLESNLYYKPRHANKFPVAFTVTPLSIEGGGGAVILFRDITKEKEMTQTIEHKVEERTAELHKTQTQLVASVNSLRQGYIMTDHKGKIVTMNHAASMLFCPEGHDKDTHNEACSMETIIDALHGEINLKAKIEHVLDRAKPLDFDNVSFGSRFIHLFISPIAMDTKVIGTTILADDVTEARILDRSRDEFFSIASHELRTPLTAIRGNAKMIDEFYSAEIKDESLKAMVHDIYDSSVRLIDIVNDFLDVSRVEQGKIKYQLAPFSLDRVIEAVIYEMNAVAKQRGISLTVNHATLDKVPKAYADKDRVKQIVYNLVGNALKFTDSGSITIDVSSTKRMIKVLVIDTGRGISPEGQKLLFRKFQQAGESLFTRDTTKGTGLGLYISKLLAEAMGGGMSLEQSQVGKGSTFAFTLQVATSLQLKQSSNQTLDKIEHDVERQEQIKSTFSSVTDAQKTKALD